MLTGTIPSKHVLHRVFELTEHGLIYRLRFVLEFEPSRLRSQVTHYKLQNYEFRALPLRKPRYSSSRAAAEGEGEGSELNSYPRCRMIGPHARSIFATIGAGKSERHPPDPAARTNESSFRDPRVRPCRSVCAFSSFRILSAELRSTACAICPGFTDIFRKATTFSSSRAASATISS